MQRKIWSSLTIPALTVPARVMLGRVMLGCSLAAVVAAAPAAAQTVLRTQVPNVEDEDYDGMIVFKDFVESRSNGSIEVEILLGSQLCQPGLECYEALEDGVLDIYITTSGGTAAVLPFIQVLDLPYILGDDRVAEAVLTGPFEDHLFDAVRDQSDGLVRLMAVGNTGGWRNFANTKRLVKTPADLAGLKIRTVVADLPQKLVEALGASPTPINWSELFTSFQTGVVEGSKNGITDIMNMNFPEAGLKFLTLDGHAYMSAIWLMNQAKFQSLDESQRRVVLDGFEALRQATFASPKRKSIEAYRQFVAQGGQIYVPTPAEKDLWKNAAQPVYAWFVDAVEDGELWLNRLQEAAQAAEADIAASHAKRLD